MQNCCGAEHGASRGFTLERLLPGAALCLVLLLGGGVYALVVHLQNTWERRADLYLVHPAPLRIHGSLSLDRTEDAHRWQVWAACGVSARPVFLRAPATFTECGPDALAWTADRLEARLDRFEDDGPLGRDFARGLRQWPTHSVKVNSAQGVLVAQDDTCRVTCLLVTSVTAGPGNGAVTRSLRNQRPQEDSPAPTAVRTLRQAHRRPTRASHIRNPSQEEQGKERQRGAQGQVEEGGLGGSAGSPVWLKDAPTDPSLLPIRW